MKSSQPALLLALGALAFAFGLAPAARAQLIITEVMSTGSSTSGADWFELTNKGASPVDITGYKMDDNSHTFASAAPLVGVTSIAVGESVVFVENAPSVATLRTFWGGLSGVNIGSYTGSGVGLSSTADEVNLYDSGGAFVTGVGFGTAPAGNASFDNHAATNPAFSTISISSVLGQFGAFLSVDTTALGSPGAIASAAAIPEPSAVAAIFGALALGGAMRRCRRRAAVLPNLP